jgi:hypothetical protein
MPVLTLRHAWTACAAILALLLPMAILAQPSTAGGFLPASPLSRGAPSAHGVKLPSGKALIVGADNVAHVFDPISGTFQETGPLVMAHAYATPALLPDGRVLLASGGADIADRRAEIYDPATNAWTLTGSTTIGRRWPAVLTASNGTVYLLGGETPGGMVATVERYNPATGSFAAAGTMAMPRARMGSVVLANGRFLLLGGVTTASILVKTAEVFDPATHLPVTVGNMSFVRSSPSAVRLLDGRVLVTGGLTAVASSVRVAAEAELFNPATNAFSPIAPMAETRIGHTAMLLPSGKVLVAGGYTDFGACIDRSEVFDPQEPNPGFVFRDGPRMPAAFCYHALVAFDDGTAVLAGGSGRWVPPGVYEPSELAVRFNPYLVFADGMGETMDP